MHATHAPSEAPPAAGAVKNGSVHLAVRDRFQGCLLGGAVGDALGAPVEFLRRSDIAARFGPSGIGDYAPAYGGLGRITDDTQMTLVTAEGLLRAWVRHRNKGITAPAAVVANAYLRWLFSQGEAPNPVLASHAQGSGWLFQQPELHSRRGPGATCLGALQAMSILGASARNNSKGCGGVMRMAPVGLFLQRSRSAGTVKVSEAFALGSELAALTHGHATGALAAGAFAVMVLNLVDGADLGTTLAAAKTCLSGVAGSGETLAAIKHAQALARSDVEPAHCIERLGEGWVAEEALAIAVYCALVAPRFESALVLAVNHDGDSDSTGAITGNLVGAMYGVAAIPERWLQPLELRDGITSIANDLYDHVDWSSGEYAENVEHNQRIQARYPGH